MLSDSTLRSSADRIERPLHRRFLIILYHQESSRVLDLAEGTELIVGRDPEVTLSLEDGQISRRHARLWREENRIFVEDLGSTNGTRVNEVAITGPQRLGPGDEVGVGTATLVVSSLALTVAHHRVLTDGEFEERLDAEVDRAKRYRRALSLIMIRLGGSAERIRPQLVALATVLRRMDLLASYGPQEYVLLLPEADGQARESVVRRLSHSLDAATGARAALGASTLPVDAHSSGMLIEIARDRLRGARRQTLGAAVVAAPAQRRRAREVVAESRAMAKALALARRIGEVDTTVLILGETGSGKQVLAEEIHRSSPRVTGPLVHVNCAAIPPSLMESELFGHERGAFTGAESRHLGFAEAASGGTLFLDEIGELSLETQPKLLHLLENQTFTRVGGVRPLRVSTRLVAATNRDLEVEVKSGRFREDLYYRLSAFVLHLPPLRERPEDIAPLAQLFLVEFTDAHGQPRPTLSPRALAALRRYHWPGNVRQLRNAMERAVVLVEGSTIEEAHLPERVVLVDAEAGAPSSSLAQQLAAVERQSIEVVLRECFGNQSEAARRLGISRRSLIYRMGKLGLR